MNCSILVFNICEVAALVTSKPAIRVCAPWRRYKSPLSRKIFSCEREKLPALPGQSREGFPAIDFAHVYLTGSKQRLKQHGGGVRRRPHSLRFDPALELLVEPFEALVVRALRHLLGGKVKVKSRSPASSRLLATASCLSRHLRMKALRCFSISSEVTAGRPRHCA
jgi:hypothetical protein